MVRPMVPILTYHSLDESGSVISIAPADFRGQMERLRDWGFVGMSLRDYWAARPIQPTQRPVVITFDDGFRNIYDVAAPWLQTLGFRATVFAVTGKVGGANDWPSHVPGLPALPLATWAQLRDLIDSGLEIGVHGMTHACLTNLRPDAARREILDSGREMEDRLGTKVRSLAYPYGRFDDSHLALAAERYDLACGTQIGMARFADDRHRLPRIDMYYLRSALAFRLLPGPLGRIYLGARSVGRRVREAFAHDALRI
jgi:peptidoglycan/xylan/chitin deacetylase (PgdA/CDA1 family)